MYAQKDPVEEISLRVLSPLPLAKGQEGVRPYIVAASTHPILTTPLPQATKWGAPDPARTQPGSVTHKPGAKPGAGGSDMVPHLHHNDSDVAASAISHSSISTGAITLPQPRHRDKAGPLPPDLIDPCTICGPGRRALNQQQPLPSPTSDSEPPQPLDVIGDKCL